MPPIKLKSAPKRRGRRVKGKTRTYVTKKNTKKIAKNATNKKNAFARREPVAQQSMTVYWERPNDRAVWTKEKWSKKKTTPCELRRQMILAHLTAKNNKHTVRPNAAKNTSGTTGVKPVKPKKGETKKWKKLFKNLSVPWLK